MLTKPTTKPSTKPLSKQRKYQNRHHARGLCILCTRRRAKLSRRLCSIHVQIERERARRRSGCAPWRPGSRGRPPAWELERRTREAAAREGGPEKLDPRMPDPRRSKAK